MADAGYFSLFDFTGLSVGGLAGVRHGSFRGAGRHALMALMAIDWRESAAWERQQILDRLRKAADADRLGVERFMRRRQNSLAMSTIVLSEM